MEAAAY